MFKVFLNKIYVFFKKNKIQMDLWNIRREIELD